MKSPLANLILSLLGAFCIFVGMAVHPSLIILGLGLVISILAILFRFEKRERRRRV